METENHHKIETLLQEEELLRLLRENPSGAEEMIERLCRENPGRAESIRLTGSLVQYYSTEIPEVAEEEAGSMWENILAGSRAEKKPARIVRLMPALAVAASVAVLLCLAFYFFRDQDKGESMREFAEREAVIGSEARIILSDGTDHTLKSNDSHIQYDKDGKEIVIEDKSNQSEKLVNRTSDEKPVYNQIIVPYAVRHSVTLSDGTVVQLNSGSKLVFPALFSGSKREVYLEGEGYFDVARDASKPFVIGTNFLNVRVLGTHFNVSAYRNEDGASVVLEEGSVEVYNNNKIDNDLCRIKPGEGCFYSDGVSGFKVHNVDVAEYTSWKDGIYQFRDQSLGSVARRIEKYYNRKILVSDRELSERILSGKLVLASSIEETIKFLAKTTKSGYKIQEDGTYVFLK
jgi:ferric-dicitrate binding protein FerR (iron transport regulator)